MKRIPFDQMKTTFEQVFLKYGYDEAKAALSAKLIAETSLDGTYSHGLNRVPRLIGTIESGYVQPDKSPIKISEHGAIQAWDGQLGPGNTNGHFCMEQAIDLAKNHGIGLVALKNTNHWMRGGAFGWQAANAGLAGICWSNTKPNMPAWGASKNILGNNPLIIAIPRAEGHIVLDMAMSQFSFGKIESYKRKGEDLPYNGGYDREGNITKNPATIEETELALPIGYWKGAGLSLMLDLLSALLSTGKATHEIGRGVDEEYGLSQVFIAIDISKNASENFIAEKLKGVIEDLHAAPTFDKNGKTYYPGERTKMTREENLAKGIPVDEQYWNKVLAMLED
jgi:3-dehydro-L-gulonate 2-dehydrogenase